MASALALGAVEAAILTQLRTDSVLLSWTGHGEDGLFGIYDFVPQRAPLPYVRVGSSGSERPYNTLGPPEALKFGSIVSVPIRVVSQYRGSEEVYRLMSRIKARLDGQRIAVEGYGNCWVTCEHTVLLTDTVNGLVTRELISDFEVVAHQ